MEKRFLHILDIDVPGRVVLTGKEAEEFGLRPSQQCLAECERLERMRISAAARMSTMVLD